MGGSAAAREADVGAVKSVRERLKNAGQSRALKRIRIRHKTKRSAHWTKESK
jgi:hypothetical protein